MQYFAIANLDASALPGKQTTTPCLKHELAVSSETEAVRTLSAKSERDVDSWYWGRLELPVERLDLRGKDAGRDADAALRARTPCAPDHLL
eukprot:361775-Rhodomonas_salina.2